MSTETITYCARHPKVETGLTCASCGTPICPKCMVTTPVGMKCPDCGRNKKSALYQVRPERLLLAGITALVAGGIAALIGAIGFFIIIFICIPYGYFAGNMILKASGMKRGLKIELVAGIGMALGALAAKLLPVLPLMLSGRLILGLAVLADPFFLIAAAVSTGAAVSKIRYL